MNKKLIRLTEQDLHRIVKESVKNILINEIGYGNPEEFLAPDALAAYKKRKENDNSVEDDFPSESVSPEGDIAEYGERYGMSALGYALYEIARNGEVELTWDLARRIWEYGGNN